MSRASRLSIYSLIAVLSLLCVNEVQARDYYVSIKRGRGKNATKEKPAKDLGNIVSKLVAGDVVHIAEGVYRGRSNNGSDNVPVPVTIIGGYADDFSKRDPWGAHRTILSGVDQMAGSTQYRLILGCDAGKRVVVDGLIIDNGDRNHYDTDKQLKIRRRANPAKNKNATPESGGIKIKLGTDCQATVKNNVVMNTAPTGGAIATWGGKNSTLTIENNLIINNTGEGIYAMTAFHPRDGQGLPSYEIKNNTILFSWKHDAIATYGGNGVKLDSEVIANITGNVLGFNDYGAIDNIKKCKKLTVSKNLVFGNRLYDYREFNTAMKIDAIEDESDILNEKSSGNVSKLVKVNVGPRFAAIYAGRKEISRAKVDAAAKVSNSGANQLRGILGLPLQASAVKMDADVWLARLNLDEAMAVAQQSFGEFGAKKP